MRVLVCLLCELTLTSHDVNVRAQSHGSEGGPTGTLARPIRLVGNSVKRRDRDSQQLVTSVSVLQSDVERRPK